jgi:hypothetical protein
MKERAMNSHPIRHRRCAWLGLWLAVALAPAAALANAQDDAATQRARFEREREVCVSGHSNQDRATCLREAYAAYAEARKGKLDDNADYARNTIARCEVLPDDDRQDCIARMHGAGTTSGSVAEGGIYRELVTRTVNPPATADAPTEPRK